MKKKIALVNHRYGMEIASGSEMHCRLLAGQLKDKADVTVLTTCAIDDNTWANHYPEGRQEIEGINVIRFPVMANRDWEPYDELDGYIDGKSDHSMEDEVHWVNAQGPYAPDLLDYIHGHYDEYDAIVFMTYLYYTSAVCILGLPNAIFLPTAHDEKALRLPFYRYTFESASGFVYNTIEEKRMLEERFEFIKGKPGFVGAFGIDADRLQADKSTADLSAPYILYAGRINAAKGCAELVSFFSEYKKGNPSDLKLVLIGKKDMELPEREDIEYRGFVSEAEKMQLMRGALFLVIGSRFESLSIVVLEALAVNTPILVTSKCEVLKGHVERSQAGYAYQGYEDFAAALSGAVKGEGDYEERKQYGYQYVKDNYSWDKVTANLLSLVDELGYRSVPAHKEINPLCAANYYNRQLMPAFAGDNVTVVMASDDNYAALLAVALQSLIDSSSTERKYDIIVLSDRISRNHKELLLLMTSALENFSLRFYEVSDRLDKWNFKFTNDQLSRGTFMRLLVPELFTEYEKIIYLDCDTIVKEDIARLFDTDIDEYMLGGIRDVHIATVWRFRESVRKHLLEVVKVPRPEDYFNAGVLLLNVRRLRAEYSSDSLFELATSRRWMWEDQDVLNHIAAGRVKFLNIKWDTFALISQELMHLMKHDLEYCAALESPYIIHYAGGTLPIKCQGEKYAFDFWQEARKTPFYEDLVGRMKVDLYQGGSGSHGRSTKKAIWAKRHLLGQFIKDYGLWRTFRMIMVLPQAVLFAPKGSRFAYIKSHVNAIRFSMR